MSADMSTEMTPAILNRASGITCPRCGSTRVHRSRRKNVLDRVLSLLGAQVRRCHDCRSRQAWFGWVSIRIPRGAY
jgi:predicted RNA-binding Zn-ribbon protein involved in translation (DUF1610 family)